MCFSDVFLYFNIVAFQRGGVSNKPTLGSGQRQDTGSGILSSVHRWTRPTGEPTNCGANQGSTGFYCVKRRTTYKKNFKKKQTVHLTRFLLRQGEPGTSQYISFRASSHIKKWQ